MTASLLSSSGVDTVSFAFRPPGRAGFEAVDEFRACSHRLGPAGALIADARGSDGGRVMCFPSSGLLAIETRLAALVAFESESHDLAPVRDLVQGGRNAREIVGGIVGGDLGPCEVRRADLAAELRFDEAAEGLAFLRGVSGLCPARMRSTLEVAGDGSVMTAYVRTAKRGVVHSRIYDKGRESGSDPPGLRVRIESQNRWPKAKRQSPEVLANRDLRPMFGRTVQPYLQTDEIAVAGPDGAVREIVGRVVRGEMAQARALAVLGTIDMLKYGGRAAFDRQGSTRVENNRRSSRQLRLLRDEGIVLSELLPPEAVVPVSALLRDCVARFEA
jgi:hypothetical protein